MGRGPEEGYLLVAIADSVRVVLGHPVLDGFLGLILGVGLLAASRASFRAITPDDPARGLTIVAVMLPLRLAFAAGALFLAHRFMVDGFLPFAISFAGGFLAVYMLELVRFSGLHRYVRPAVGRRDGR